MTRKTLAQIELIRALILAALTFVLALPVGLGLAWVLLAVINVEAFGWRLPMSLFPARLALAGASVAGRRGPRQPLARLSTGQTAPRRSDPGVQP